MPKKTRSKRVSKALKENPNYDEGLLNEIADDADKYHALKTVMDQEGGEILVDSLITDVARYVDRLASSHAELTLSEFISLSARIEVSLGMARSLTRAGKNLEGADEALKASLRL